MTQSIYIPRGVNTEALSQSIMWDYQPQGFKVCSLFSLCETYLYQPKTSFLDACIHVPTSVIQHKMVTMFCAGSFLNFLFVTAIIALCLLFVVVVYCFTCHAQVCILITSN